MFIKIRIEANNAAFEDGNAGPEVSRILKKLASTFEGWPGANEFDLGLYDVNGNMVGDVEVSTKD